MGVLEDQRAKIGVMVKPTAWQSLDQEAVQKFANLTGDQQFIHTQPEVAAMTPFGGTIVHGFFTLSLLAPMAADVLDFLPGQRMALNYGFEKLRFLAPVPTGARIRGHFKLENVEERQPGQFLHQYEVTIEIEGQEKPALVASWLYLVFCA